MTDRQPTLQTEEVLLNQGYRQIAGLDEAGRGAWAGPVVAAAVTLPVGQPGLITALAGLTDSKQLSPAKRETFFTLIQQNATAIGVGLASAEKVDEINVLEATRYAMVEALTGLTPPTDYLLLDHVRLPQIELPQLAFPKADRLSLTVAAASIIAKVTRDRLMIELSSTYPHYAFERHKGYGTQTHRQALAQHGPCPIHRLSYRPVRDWQNLQSPPAPPPEELPPPKSL